jgi:hypothetical protein
VLADFQGIVFLDVGSGAALLGRELAITDEAVRSVVHGGKCRGSPGGWKIGSMTTPECVFPRFPRSIDSRVPF